LLPILIWIIFWVSRPVEN
jgi:hypothetical protein